MPLLRPHLGGPEGVRRIQEGRAGHAVALYPLLVAER